MPDDVPAPGDEPASGDYELQHCLDALAALGDDQRYRILETLSEAGELSASGLRDRVEGISTGFHYHLEQLEDAGLVTNRRAERRTASGVHSYYSVSDLGEALLRTVGVLTGEIDYDLEAGDREGDVLEPQD